MLRILFALLLGAGCVLSFDVPAARACSPLQAGIFGRRVFPAAGSDGVPTNVQVVVGYRVYGDFGSAADAGDPGLGTDLRLRRKGGEAVVVTSTGLRTKRTESDQESVFTVQPHGALMPMTEYEVLDRRPTLPCGRSHSTSCDLGAETVIATFTTGAGPDTTPPAVPPAAALISGDFSVCESTACCGPYLGKNFTARWNAAPSAEPLLYTLEGVEGTVGGGGSGAGVSRPLAVLMPVNQLDLNVACQAGSADPNRLWVAAGPVRVYAVDMAGNASPFVDLGSIPANACAGAPIGGGSPPFVPPARSAGCSLSPGGRREAGLATALFVVLLGAACPRRRRAPISHRRQHKFQ